MICAHCGYDDEGLNPFSKCLRCGLPFDMPIKSATLKIEVLSNLVKTE